METGKGKEHDVREEDGQIELVLVRPQQKDEVLAKLEKMGVTEKDVEEAIKWTRRK